MSIGDYARTDIIRGGKLTESLEAIMQQDRRAARRFAFCLPITSHIGASSFDFCINVPRPLDIFKYDMLRV